MKRGPGDQALYTNGMEVLKFSPGCTGLGLGSLTAPGSAANTARALGPEELIRGHYKREDFKGKAIGRTNSQRRPHALSSKVRSPLLRGRLQKNLLMSFPVRIGFPPPRVPSGAMEFGVERGPPARGASPSHVSNGSIAVNSP
ncbi:hypothetical protein SKAU_G00050330 [Synaphobranchus kaupii]|uniref:Uncharacterized protein n=1 Tax=Synaphobranchus kaupii TaxID=118154 RepID=A0A9Q1G2V0_SYNKA|nr:hypothetical protein SKAU_G00050330 [Synaphobranchus kaupii]